MTNFQKMLDMNINIQNVDPLSDMAVWPNGIEICIARVPIRKRDGYSLDMMKKFAERLKPKMTQNGIIFLVCYAPTEDKSRPFEVARTMSDAGFKHIDNIVIQKTWFPGKRSEVNLVNSHEYVFHFCNGDVWKLDRTPIRMYLDVDDSITCPGNSWPVHTGSLEESIPVDLAELLIRMTDALPGSIVFDPFGGNSATLQASIKLGHSCWLIERDVKKLKKYQKIIDALSKE